MSDGKNQWMIWTIVAVVIVVILIAFNYQGDKSDVVPLSEIFPEDNMQASQGVEYEYVPADSPQARQVPAEAVPPAKSAPKTLKAKQPAAAPAAVTAPAPVAAPSVPAQGNYAIQILSSTDKAATEKALEKAKGKGLTNAYLVTKETNSGTRYRIYAGPFATKQEADAALPTVQGNYKDAYIISTK